MIRYALLDLDDTLYPRQAGVLQAVGRRIESYLIERMHMAPDAAARLRTEYRDRYGTTLAGLLAHHQTDAEDYLAYVHDVEVEQLLQPSTELGTILHALPWELAIFTNADRPHAERVLHALGVRGCFDRIFDITFMAYRQKPQLQVYSDVLAALGAGGSACLMVDDTLLNLRPAREIKMTTVWVVAEASPTEGADFAIPRIEAIAEVAERLRAQGRC